MGCYEISRLRVDYPSRRGAACRVVLWKQWGVAVSSGELGISDSHVAKRVKRLEQRRHEELPLFATVPAVLDQFAPPPTAERVRAELEGMQNEVLNRLARSRAWAQAKATQYRARVGEYITEDQLQHMDAYIERAYPRGECYAADYWRTLATRLGVLL